MKANRMINDSITIDRDTYWTSAAVASQRARELRITGTPFVSVDADSSVQLVVEKMAARGAKVALVVSEDRVTGIFTSRDLLSRVIAKRLSPDETAIWEVMTSPVKAISSLHAPLSSDVVNGNGVGCLPVIDGRKKIIGVLRSIDILLNRVEGLKRENETLAAYLSADGIGG
jgi:signal-transduction protein with cAMP-binding, CBS, and nucleotidyltransferase domain